jgi:hypothetical protein
MVAVRYCCETKRGRVAVSRRQEKVGGHQNSNSDDSETAAITVFKYVMVS